MSAAIALPSNSMLPPVAGASPAINSSRVDFPQPEGPTTAKNSPGLRSRSMGPSACSPAAAPAAGNTLVTPRRQTCACDTLEAPPWGSLLRRPDVVGQEARVDQLGDVDVARERTHHFLHFDHALHAVEIKLPGAPIGHALGLAGDQVGDGAARHFLVEIVVLGDDIAGLRGVARHELHRLTARADHG